VTAAGCEVQESVSVRGSLLDVVVAVRIVE